MRSPRSFCATSAARLRTFAVRFCLLVLTAALVPGCAKQLRGQAQQPASQATKPNADQSNSGQANSGQSGVQDSQPQQNNGSSAGAPMVLGEGDEEGTPGEQPPAQPPAAQPSAAQPGQNPVEPDDRTPPVQQQTVPAATAVDTDPQPALAALPPGPPDSSDPRKVVDWECADLLKLANDLKLAVDKTTKDELSLSVVRKAGEIEQMAHKLRDDMRPAVAGKD